MRQLINKLPNITEWPNENKQKKCKQRAHTHTHSSTDCVFINTTNELPKCKHKQKNLNVNLNNFPSALIRRIFSYSFFIHFYFKKETKERTKFTQFVSFCLCTIFVRYFSFPLHCALRPYVCHFIFIFYLLFIFTI